MSEPSTGYRAVAAPKIRVASLWIAFAAALAAVLFEATTSSTRSLPAKSDRGHDPYSL
ncbi:MAG: hypothetical protein U0V73_09405 [Acidimicrobiia bacterium]